MWRSMEKGQALVWQNRTSAKEEMASNMSGKKKAVSFGNI